MDKADIEKFVRVLEFLDSVEGQLNNFNNRAGKAAVEAKARFVQQGIDVPTWKPMAAALIKLQKATPAALKAANEINKICAAAADKKKGGSLSLADAKKKARSLLPKIQAVDDCVAEISSHSVKIYKELGMATLGRNIDLNVTAEKYCPMFTKYYADFKINLNKL